MSTSFRKIGNRVRLDRTLPFVSYRCSARKVAEEILAIELREAAITRLRCQSGNIPKTRGTPHIMAARLRGQQRWRGILSSPRYSAGLPHTRLLWKGTSAVAVKSKGQSDIRTSLVWANLSAIINCPRVALSLSPLFPLSRIFDGAQSGAVECQFRNRRKSSPRLIHVKLAVDRAR